MPRETVQAAEEILDKEFPCLDKGFVRLVDYLGGDKRVVSAARVSYGEGTKTIREDAGLIDYLMRKWHTSPFEQVQLTVHCKMPVFVARQWVRHRTARLNEISGRYSIMKDEFYVPKPEHVCYQSTDNKQGRSGPLEVDKANAVIARMVQQQKIAYGHYNTLVNAPIEGEDDDMEGFEVARELGRVNLPLSLYTEWYWQVDLHNLFHFLQLRLDAHAQYEIRVFAEALYECAKAVAPMACAAFENHRLGAVTFSRDEQALLAAVLNGLVGDLNEPKDYLLDAVRHEQSYAGFPKSRQAELLAKLSLLLQTQ